MEYVDLSLPIVPHWRYPIQIEDAKSFKKGDLFNIKQYALKSHWYTHIDAPLHYVDGGKHLDEFPLDILIGKALILDLSHVSANEAITEYILKKAVGDAKDTNFIIIKTCWEQKTDWNTTDYWDNAPYITEDGAKFIASLNPKVVGFDFPQDYDIRKLRYTDESECFLTTHEYILKNNILMIEYLTNMWNVSGKYVDIIALPITLPKSDGGQIRVVAKI
ncbi:MAG: hypothetical protein ATN32_05205 [Candidatus Epulonipiscium fishelsonii]|nr:MAG: hypothetical protein ATN32_05205 [Epulopiscium sp. AS2M-Bin002]